MAVLQFQKNKLIQKVTAQLREQLAIYLLVFHLEKGRIEKTKRAIEKLSNAPTRTLRMLVDEYAEKLTGIRQHYGIRVSASELLRFLDQVEKAPPGKGIQITKHNYLELSDHASKFIKHFDRLPSHARIEFSMNETAGVEIYQLEAKFYEDMCALYNAWARVETMLGKYSTKVEIKHEAALYRATLVSVFNFIECFLNGLAYEYYLNNEKQLSQAVKDQLREWDSAKKKPKYLNFRDKLLIYPKIITASTHPPVQESHCPEMKILVEQIKLVRDAIAHASPGPHPEGWGDGKEQKLLNPDPVELNNAVDAAIGLARRLSLACGHSPDRLLWIEDRDSTTGTFPDSVFS
jgi:ribosome-associated translation inhibitor RaiA